MVVFLQIVDGKFLIRVYYKEGRYQTLQVDGTTVDMFVPAVCSSVLARDNGKEWCFLRDQSIAVVKLHSFNHIKRKWYT